MILTSSIITKICRELEDPRSDPEDEREYSTQALLDWLYDGYRLLLPLIIENNPAMVWRKDRVDFTEPDDGSKDLTFTPIAAIAAYYTNKNYWLSPIRDSFSIPNVIVYGSAVGAPAMPMMSFTDFDPEETGHPVAYFIEGEKTLSLRPIPAEDIRITLWSVEDPESFEWDPGEEEDTQINIPSFMEPYLKEYTLVRARNRGEASMNLEASFMQNWEKEIRYQLEKRAGGMLTAGSSYVAE